MLRFKQFVDKSYFIESLNQDERDHVDSLGLSTANGAKNFRGIVPEGQTHVEVPLESPMDLKIKDHLANTSVTDRNGKHLGYYKRDPENPKMAIHPDGRKVKLSGALKGNPELLKQYAEMGSRGTKPSGDKKSFEFRNRGITRWTNDTDVSNRKAFISYHPHAVFGKSHGEDIPWTSCNKWGSGHASDNLEDDVREGGGAAYLTHANETNPNNPTHAVGRIALHPYHAVDSNGNFLKDKDGNYLHTIIRPSSKGYGEEDSNERFRNTIRQHLEEKHPMIYPAYKLNPNVYQKDEPDSIIRRKMSPDEKKEHLAAFEDKIKHGSATDDDIQHAHDNEFLNQKHLKDIAGHENSDASTLGEVAEKSDDPEVHKLLVNHKNAVSNTFRRVVEKSNDPEVHKMILKHPKVDSYVLKIVAEKSNDPEVHKAILKHPKVDGNVLEAVAEKSNDPEVHKAIINHPEVSRWHLSDIAARSDDPEIHKMILNHPKTDSKTLSNLAYKIPDDSDLFDDILNHHKADDGTFSDLLKSDPGDYSKQMKIMNKKDKIGKETLHTLSDLSNPAPATHKFVANHPKSDWHTLLNVSQNTRDPEVQKAIVAHPNADENSLHRIARNTKDPEIHKAILNHPNVDDDVLGTISARSTNPEVHRDIINHDKVSPSTLRSLAMKTTSKKNMKAIAEHPNADHPTLHTVMTHSNDPEVHKAIAKNQNATNKTLDELVKHTDDPEVHKLIAEHPNARDDISNPTLSRIISKSNDPEVHEALAQNKHLSDNAFKKIRHTNPGKLHKLRSQALRPPQTEKNPDFDLHKTDWFKESFSTRLLRKVRGK